jgi:hypothetical protein
VLLVVLYVALDLSLPAMPGAFVFDAASSIESARDSRARPSAPSDVAVRPQAMVARVAGGPAMNRAHSRRAAALRRSRARPLPGTRRVPPPAIPSPEDPH